MDAHARPTIYGASRASIPERPAMWRALRAAGHRIISTWIDEDGPGETLDYADLWTRIEAEVKAADALILFVLPEDLPLKGAFVEVGIALGAGIPVFVVAPGCLDKIGSWTAHPLVTVCETVGEALKMADAIYRLEMCLPVVAEVPHVR